MPLPLGAALPLAPAPALFPTLPLPALHPLARPLPATAPLAPYQKAAPFFSTGFPAMLSMMLPLLVMPKILEDPGRVIAGFTLRPVLQGNQFSQARRPSAHAPVLPPPCVTQALAHARHDHPAPRS